MKVKKLIALTVMLCMGVASISGCTSKSSESQTTQSTVESKDVSESNSEGSSANVSKNVKTIEDYKSTGKIVMGTNATFAPFEYHQDREIVGFDVEISQKIAEKIGVELSIEDMSFEGLINALNSGKIDFIAAGMTNDEERRKNVDFSKGYYNSTQAISVLKSNTEIKSKDDLKNKKIGVQIGTTGSEKAKEIEGATVVEYDNGPVAMMDLKNGKIDAMVLDLEPSKSLAKQNEDVVVLDEGLTEEEYAIAVRKGETELVDLINSTIDEMRQNGEYDSLIDKYFN